MGWCRSSFGLYNERVGSTGYHHWADQVGSRAAGEPSCQFSVIKPNGIISSISLERAREGINDRAYYNTLKCYIAELEKKNKIQAVKYCTQVLNSIVKDVPLDRYEYANWRTKILTGQELDLRRSKVVTAIETAIKILNNEIDEKNLNAIEANIPFLSDSAVKSSSNSDKIESIYASTPVLIDGNLEEDCWKHEINTTNPLWWIGKDEGAMRAHAGDQESFNELYTPVTIITKVACDSNGLYFAINSAKASSTDKIIILLRTNDNNVLEVSIGTQNTVEIKLPNGNVKSEIIKSATAKHDDGRLTQELFIPWSIINLKTYPEAGASLGLQIAHISSKGVLTWIKVKNSPDENWGRILF
jgi:hypothetical protein